MGKKSKDQRTNGPEKRSRDILASYKHTTYKFKIKMAEQTLTLITHNPPFTHSVYNIYQIPGHR